MNKDCDSYLKYYCCRVLTTGTSDVNQAGGWFGRMYFEPTKQRTLRSSAEVDEPMDKLTECHVLV